MERSADGSVPRLPSTKRTGVLPEVKHLNMHTFVELNVQYNVVTTAYQQLPSSLQLKVFSLSKNVQLRFNNDCISIIVKANDFHIWMA